MFNNYQNYHYGTYPTQNYAPRAYNVQPQPQPQIPIETPIQDIKFVNKAQAEAYIVFPNTKVMLIDNESKMVYIKTADNMGQSTTDYFRFEKINSDGTPIKPQEQNAQIDLDSFVKIDEFKALQEKIEQIQKRLEGVKNNVGAKQPEARVQM